MAKSDSVQHIYREILIDPSILSTLSFLSTEGDLSPEAKDELLELTEQLTVKIRDIIDNKLTKRQSEVVKLIFFEQKTQMEVAYLLGLCQTTIHKLIAGNIDYSNGGKRYGGAIKKIRKHLKLVIENPFNESK
jgi:DNA-directed RNA polymerase specialized sigma subunit